MSSCQDCGRIEVGESLRRPRRVVIVTDELSGDDAVYVDGVLLANDLNVYAATLGDWLRGMPAVIESRVANFGKGSESRPWPESLRDLDEWIDYTIESEPPVVDVGMIDGSEGLIVRVSGEIAAVFANASDAGLLYGRERVESARLRKLVAEAAGELSDLVGGEFVDGSAAASIRGIASRLLQAIEYRGAAGSTDNVKIPAEIPG